MRALFAAFPDWSSVQVEDVVAEGDKVVVRTVWRGTHEVEASRAERPAPTAGRFRRYRA
jgi:predicted ester cyclase